MIEIGKLAKMIGIKGFVIIGMAIALGIVMWRADVISGKLEDKRNELAAERAGHAITRQSVATLEQSLSRFIGAGKAAKIAQLAAIEAQAKDSAELQAQADAIRSEMSTLTSDAKCTTPKSIIDARGL